MSSNTENENSGKGFLIGLVIFLSIVAGVVAVFYFNIGGATDKILIPTLNKIGLFEDIIPQEDNPYAEYTTEDFIALIEDYKNQIKQLNDKIDNLDNMISEKDKEITRLQAFEEEQLTFKQEKENFDKMLVDNEYSPPIETYIQFFESIYPQTAEQIYKEAIETVQYDKNISDYVKTYEEMDSDSAAAILEQITNTDIELVSLILNEMSADSRASILEGMSVDTAARVSKFIAPSK